MSVVYRLFGGFVHINASEIATPDATTATASVKSSSSSRSFQRTDPTTLVRARLTACTQRDATHGLIELLVFMVTPTR
jgi:hypothetical protein